MTWSSPVVLVLAVGLGAIAVVLAVALWPSSPGLAALWTGAKGDPRLQALVRSLLLYVVPTCAAALVGLIGGLDNPLLVPLVPILIGLVRWLEGAVMRAVPVPPAEEPQEAGDG